MLIASLRNDIVFECGGEVYHLKAGDRVIVDTQQDIAYHNGVEYPFEIYEDEYSV